MASLNLRVPSGLTPLTNQQVDDNFQNLNNALGAAGSTTIPTPTGTGGPVLSNNPILGNATLGNISTGNGVSTGSAYIELGGARTGAGLSFIDFHATAGTDYETRVSRNGGANGSFDVYNTGTGGIGFVQVGAGPISFAVNSAEKARFDASGYLLIGTTTASGTNLLQVNSDALINGQTVGRGLGAVATNTAHGVLVLANNTTGTFNTGVGYLALQYNIGGAQNTAVGNGALQNNTSGNYNSAFGVNALVANTSGASNCAFGLQAMSANTLGTVNNAFGFYALTLNTLGTGNNAFGRFALTSSTTFVASLGTITGGSLYTAGTYTNVVMTLASGSTAVTYPTATIVVSGGAVTSVTITSPGSGFKDTTTVLTAPAASIGGTGSGFSVPVASLATSNNNVAIGDQALRLFYNGNSNTAVGYLAGSGVTGGGQNTFIGANAGNGITVASNNVIIGGYTGAAAPISGTGSNYIVLSDGAGTIRQVIDSAGNTGFGTTAPTTTLSIASAGGSQKRALFISSGSGAGSGGGVYITSATTSGGNGAVYEAIGQRADGNGSAQFSGTTALGRLRTDLAISTSGITLGRMTFGGNPTGTALSNILYSAQIAGVSDTAWSSSSAMGTALVFYTGAAGIDINSVLGDAGSEAMRISSAGNLGVGTSSPGTKLDVSGVTRSTTFSLGASSSGTAFGAGTISTDANWGMYFRANSSPTQADFVFVNSAGTERMRIWPTDGMMTVTSTGSPIEGASSLAGLSNVRSINTNASGIPGIELYNGVAWTAGKSTGQIRFDGLTTLSTYTVYASIQTVSGNNTSTGAPTDMLFTTSDGTASAVERMRIDSAGDVGIGTTTPISKLMVYGAGQTTANLTDAGARTNIIRISDSGVAAGNGGAITFGNLQADNANSLGFAAIKGLLTNGATNTTGDLAFSTRNAVADTALTERMRITALGNVAIGTTTAAVKFVISSTDAILLPKGTVAQRPTGVSGYLRFNTELSKFEGHNGTAWGTVGGGATGGGSDQVFYENGQIVTVNYSITSGKSAMSTGPVTINTGIVVTIPSGSRWVIL